MSNPKKQFSKTYSKNVDKIYRFVFLKVTSQEIAEDLTAQVFTKCWDRFRHGHDEIENVSAYLYQIARAEIANHYRRESKFTIVSEKSMQIKDSDSNIEEDLQLKNDFEMMKYYLGQLDMDYQNVIIWRYLDELPIKEIAEMMEKTEGAIRVIIHRALKELREKMIELNC